MFLAVERLLRLIDENGEDAFCVVCTKLNVMRSTSVELAFLNEYVVFQSEKICSWDTCCQQLSNFVKNW